MDMPVNAPGNVRTDWPDWPWFGVEDDHLPALQRWLAEGRRMVLATLVEIRGSSPRPLGSEMLIADDGQCVGYVSGGCVEAAVVDAALLTLADGEARLLDYGHGSPILDIQLSCGGRIFIFVRELERPDAYFAARITARAARRGISVVTDLTNGRWHAADGRESATTGHFSRYYPAPLRLVAVGGDPVTLAVAGTAQQAGLEVVLLRPNGPPQAPAGLDLAGYDSRALAVALADLQLDDRCAIYTFSHDEDTDHAVLARALATPVFAAGALGSRNKIPARAQRLREAGFETAAIERLRMPAGLNIGTRTPLQIAIAVVAEVLAEAPHD
jgi:xanthine dehydrogenase accessory factor